MGNHKQQAQKLRDRAEECRRLAALLTMPSRQAYLSLAEAYETLAAQEEVMQIKNRTSEGDALIATQITYIVRELLVDMESFCLSTNRFTPCRFKSPCWKLWHIQIVCLKSGH